MQRRTAVELLAPSERSCGDALVTVCRGLFLRSTVKDKRFRVSLTEFRAGFQASAYKVLIPYLLAMVSRVSPDVASQDLWQSAATPFYVGVGGPATQTAVFSHRLLQAESMYVFHMVNWAKEISYLVSMEAHVSPVEISYHAWHCEVVPLRLGAGGPGYVAVANDV